MRVRQTLIVIFVLLNFVVLSSAAPYEGKRILFVDSYHEGYEWSDGITAGIQKVLADTAVELKIVRMDTKRHQSEDFKRRAALEAKAEIEAFKPDVVIASDDNASKYLVIPFYKDAQLPFVFCGLNWDAAIYGYPYKNATGMVEVDLVEQLIAHLKKYAHGSRIGYLTVDAETERKVVEIYNKRFFNGQLKAYWAKTFEQFTAQFLQAQKEVDILYISNNAGIDHWDTRRALNFFERKTRIPTGSRNLWMAPYVLITMAKVPEEQGVWAAHTALKILDGAAPSDIPLATNKEARLTVNMKIADTLGVLLDPALLKTAEIITSNGMTQQ